MVFHQYGFVHGFFNIVVHFVDRFTIFHQHALVTFSSVNCELVRGLYQMIKMVVQVVFETSLRVISFDGEA